MAPVQEHICLQMSFTLRKLIFLIIQKYLFFLALISAYQTLSTFDTYFRVFPLLSLLLRNFPSALLPQGAETWIRKKLMLSLDLVDCIAIGVLSSGRFPYIICLCSYLIPCSRADAFPKHSTPPVFQHTDIHTCWSSKSWKKKLPFLGHCRSLFLEAEGEVRQQGKANIMQHQCRGCVLVSLPPSNAISLLLCSSFGTCVSARTYSAR